MIKDIYTVMGSMKEITPNNPEQLKIPNNIEADMVLTRAEPNELHGSKTKFDNAISKYQEAIPCSHKADHTKARSTGGQCKVKLFNLRAKMSPHNRKRMLCDKSGGVRDSAAVVLDIRIRQLLPLVSNTRC